MGAYGSWLCPTERDRERLIEMSARVRRARTISTIAAGSPLVICAPWFGPIAAARFGRRVVSLFARPA